MPRIHTTARRAESAHPDPPDRPDAPAARSGSSLVIVPLFALTLVAYFERESIFGVDAPVRIAAAIVMVALGWALARDLGRFTAPALFRRMDPATAGTAGFLIRFAFLVVAAIALAARRRSGPAARWPSEARSPRWSSVSPPSRRSAT